MEERRILAMTGPLAVVATHGEDSTDRVVSGVALRLPSSSLVVPALFIGVGLPFAWDDARIAAAGQTLHSGGEPERGEERYRLKPARPGTFRRTPPAPMPIEGRQAVYSIVGSEDGAGLFRETLREDAVDTWDAQTRSVELGLESSRTEDVLAEVRQRRPWLLWHGPVRAAAASLLGLPSELDGTAVTLLAAVMLPTGRARRAAPSLTRADSLLIACRRVTGNHEAAKQLFLAICDPGSASLSADELEPNRQRIHRWRKEVERRPELQPIVIPFHHEGLSGLRTDEIPRTGTRRRAHYPRRALIALRRWVRASIDRKLVVVSGGQVSNIAKTRTLARIQGVVPEGTKSPKRP